MTHSSGTEPVPEQVSDEENSAGEPYPTAAPRQLSPWLTWAALAIAVIAAALAIVAWFRPAHGGTSGHFSDQQTADAKTKVCAAYTTMHQAVVTATHLGNPVPNDPSGQLAVAANARVALLGGGAYLRNSLADEPAAPADLTKAVKSMASTIEQLGAGYLAGLDSTLGPLRHDLDAEITQINGLCG